MKLLNKIKIALILAFLSIFIFSIKTMATTGIVTEITVNVRQKPTTDSKRVMYVTQDNEVEIIEKEGQWYKIKYNNKVGYIFEKYIQIKENEQNIKETYEELSNSENNKESNKETDIKTKIEKDTEIRIIPNVCSSVIYISKEEKDVNIIEQLNEWIYVSVDNIYGWLRKDKILEKDNNLETKKDNTNENTNKENAESKKEEIAYVKYKTVNLREEPSTSSKVLEKLKLNDEVIIIKSINTVWYEVKINDVIGYISKDLLSNKKQDEEEEKNETSTSRGTIDDSRENNKESNDESEKKDNKENEKVTSTSNSNSSVNGSDIVDYAKQYLGYKYVLGKSSPKEGFDCSGFTSYVYKHFGYSLARTAKGQSEDGIKVNKDDLQLGDLLIFYNQSMSKIGHVGIYVGNNQIIHASQPGVGVTITDLNAKGYNYSKRYVTARRIIK